MAGAKTIERILGAAIDAMIEDHTAHEIADELGIDLAAEPSDVRSFREAGVLTNDAGLVLYLDDGSEYQITIVRSR